MGLGVDLIKKFQDNGTWSQLMKTSESQTNREEEQKPTAGKWMEGMGGFQSDQTEHAERQSVVQWFHLRRLAVTGR